MTISGGSLCAGTCRLTIGSSLSGVVSLVVGVMRRCQCSVPSASQISHRYAQHSKAAKTSRSQSSTPPAVLAGPRWLSKVHSSA